MSASTQTRRASTPSSANVSTRASATALRTPLPGGRARPGRRPRRRSRRSRRSGPRRSTGGRGPRVANQIPAIRRTWERLRAWRLSHGALRPARQVLTSQKTSAPPSTATRSSSPSRVWKFRATTRQPRRSTCAAASSSPSRPRVFVLMAGDATAAAVTDQHVDVTTLCRSRLDNVNTAWVGDRGRRSARMTCSTSNSPSRPRIEFDVDAAGDAQRRTRRPRRRPAVPRARAAGTPSTGSSSGAAARPPGARSPRGARASSSRRACRTPTPDSAPPCDA